MTVAERGARFSQLISLNSSPRVLAYWITAMGTAVFGDLGMEVPDNFWEGQDVAVYRPVEGFVSALEHMAQIAGTAVKGG